MHDDDAIAHAEQFFHVARDHPDRHAAGGKFVDQRVDFRLGSDVHAARGLVENQHLRPAREPFAENDLLLIAAREQADRLGGTRRLHVQLADRFIDECGFLPRPHEAARAEAIEIRQAQVEADAGFEHEAVQPSIFGGKQDAGGKGVGRFADADRRAIQFDFTVRNVPHAEHGFCQFRPSGANEAGHAQHFAGTDLERRGVTRPG